MNLETVGILVRSSGSDFDWLWLAVGVVYVTARCLRLFIRWLNGKRARHWPTVFATVDVVSVVKQVEQAGRGITIVNYLATLTYFYRNPDLQTGDYSSLFGQAEESVAQAWAASYKGRTITVHVDPRDPTRSVLRKEEL